MHWRFIPLMAGTGAFHMAADEWLLEQHRQGLQPSILRFYTWEPIALSLDELVYRALFVKQAIAASP